MLLALGCDDIGVLYIINILNNLIIHQYIYHPPMAQISRPEKPLSTSIYIGKAPALEGQMLILYLQLFWNWEILRQNIIILTVPTPSSYEIPRTTPS